MESMDKTQIFRKVASLIERELSINRGSVSLDNSFKSLGLGEDDLNPLFRNIEEILRIDIDSDYEIEALRIYPNCDDYEKMHEDIKLKDFVDYLYEQHHKILKSTLTLIL